MVFAIAIMLLCWGGVGIWTREMVLVFKPTDTILRLTKWRAMAGGLLCIGVAIMLLMILFSSQSVIVHVGGCALNMLVFIPSIVLLYAIQSHGFDADEEKAKRKMKE